MSDNDTERLLGALVQRVTNVEQGVSRVEKQVDDQRQRWEDMEKDLRTEVQHLRDFTIEVKGGKRVLIALLAVATTLGALIWNVIKTSFF